MSYILWLTLWQVQFCEFFLWYFMVLVLKKTLDKDSKDNECTVPLRCSSVVQAKSSNMWHDELLSLLVFPSVSCWCTLINQKMTTVEQTLVKVIHTHYKLWYTERWYVKIMNRFYSRTHDQIPDVRRNQCCSHETVSCFQITQWRLPGKSFCQ